jgi:nicotinamide-nucleotide adenylyltransferase
MAYEPKLNPSRGLMIERLGFTRQDLDLIKKVLGENDEIVIGIGGAEKSHEMDRFGYLMTAGERIDVLNHVLKSEGIGPGRYTIVPIKDSPSSTIWAADTRTLTPRWQTAYTRNFKNASILEKFQNHYGYEVQKIEEQRPQIDLFEVMARDCKGHNIAAQELKLYFPEAAIQRMKELGIDKRADIIYNHSNVKEEPKNPKRALFLGRVQPFSGVYQHSNGHIGNIRAGLSNSDEVVTAIGSAQKSHRESDPLTAGSRIEVMRYALARNGVDLSKVYMIPVKDIPEDNAFAAEVVSLCPAFDSIIAGNDWTKQLFGEGNYGVIPVERNCSHIRQMPISGTYIRETVMKTIKENAKKGDKINLQTIQKIQQNLEDMLDPATFEILEAVGYYDMMAFLAFAKE